MLFTLLKSWPHILVPVRVFTQFAISLSLTCVRVYPLSFRRTHSVNATEQENAAAIMEDAKAFGLGVVAVTILQFIFATLSVDVINRSAQKQISRIRQLFLKAVLRQDMTWYDLNSDDSFAVRITE